MRFFTLLFFFSSIAFADPIAVRWTGSEDKDSGFEHILSVIRSKTQLELKKSDFQLFEDRELANSHFQMHLQTSVGVPMHNMSIRIWTDRTTGGAIQVEAFLDSPSQKPSQVSAFAVQRLRDQLSSQETIQLVRSYILGHQEDRQIQDMKWTDTWMRGSLIRLVQVKARRGKYKVRVSLERSQVLDSVYEEYPQADRIAPSDQIVSEDEFSIRAQIFPIYEEVDTGSFTERVPAELKYLKSRVARVTADPYSSLRTQKYTSDHLDPILGETEEGRAQGYWSMRSIRAQAAKIQAELPLSANAVDSGGIILQGRYATVSLHPDAVRKAPDLGFTSQLSDQFYPDWQDTETDEVYEMIPRGSLLGKPLMSMEDAWNRPARRLPDHDPVAYMNDGFDELQVYYAVNTLFDSLRTKGFTDPDLSTRPFNAFLYNPDIAMRNNAFYTDDTINFTTYSSGASNFARDNPTIWHELGHGIMDRLMGDQIQLADTGGLSEGMADFIAAWVIQDVSEGKPFPGSNQFRILNKTGFHLTNEVHDDGEAYGGAMNDMLTLAIAKFGRSGLTKVVDLTLESMRLTRNHPALTAAEWFSHMLFADELGNQSVRPPGELHDLILAALAGRNFDLQSKSLASMDLKQGDREILSYGPGSRGNPIKVNLASTESVTYPMSVRLKDGESYRFRFPVQMKIEFHKGALQGAVHWVGEENGSRMITLNSPEEVAKFDLTVTGKCDEVNQPDGSCSDYAYVQAWNQGESEKPQAKKRFYVRVMPKDL